MYFSIKKMLIISVCILLRTPTANVPYVPNTKYFAHLAHQTPFDPIYQMCHISFFCNMLQYKYKFSTVRNPCGICFILFLFLFLSHLFVSLTWYPNPFLSLSPQSSPLKPQPSLLFHAHTHAYANLSLAMVFLLLLLFWLWFDGFGSDGGGWVRMG